MKIKLTINLPINASHGAKKGKIFEVTTVNRSRGLYFFKGADGAKCGAYSDECEVIEDKENKAVKEHNWRKTNLVTIMQKKGTGSYDTFKCSVCGVTGKRFTIPGPVYRDVKYRAMKYNNCKGDN